MLFLHLDGRDGSLQGNTAQFAMGVDEVVTCSTACARAAARGFLERFMYSATPPSKSEPPMGPAHRGGKRHLVHSAARTGVVANLGDVVRALAGAISRRFGAGLLGVLLCRID